MGGLQGFESIRCETGRLEVVVLLIDVSIGFSETFVIQIFRPS